MKQVTGKTKSPQGGWEVSIQHSLDGHSFSIAGLDSLTRVGGVQEGPAAVSGPVQDEAAPAAEQVSGAGDGAVARRIEVEIVTPRTMLVPKELFDPECGRELLAAAGIRPAQGERIVWSDPGMEAVALMCVSEEALRQLEARLEELQQGGRPQDQAAEASAENGADASAEPIPSSAEADRGQRGSWRIGYTTPLLKVPARTSATVWMCRKGGVLYIKVYRERALRMAEAIPAALESDLLYVAGRMQQAYPLGCYELVVAGDDAKTLRRLFGKRFGKSLCE